MTRDEKDLLQDRVRKALDFSTAPMVLIHPDGRVRRVLTAFGDPVPGWVDTLTAAGIACDPDVGAKGGS